jgi:hypothetical protein
VRSGEGIKWFLLNELYGQKRTTTRACRPGIALTQETLTAGDFIKAERHDDQPHDDIDTQSPEYHLLPGTKGNAGYCDRNPSNDCFHKEVGERAMTDMGALPPAQGGAERPHLRSPFRPAYA